MLLVGAEIHAGKLLAEKWGVYNNSSLGYMYAHKTNYFYVELLNTFLYGRAKHFIASCVRIFGLSLNIFAKYSPWSPLSDLSLFQSSLL